ncbi:MAG: divergent polysaccharide deacetylase family protein [Gemmatimonadota bacterium]
MLMLGAFLAGLLAVAAALLIPGRRPESPFSQPLPAPMKIGQRPDPGSAPAPPAASGLPGEGRLAVVVDGLGYDPTADAECLKMPEKVSVAVIPFGPSSRRIAQAARSRGFTVLISVPMEPEAPVSDRTDGFRMRRGMSRDAMGALLSRMAQDVPSAAGASNFMGSAFTADPEAMGTFAELLRAKGLYLVDSVTTAKSKAVEAARIAGIPAARRDVSMDPELSPAEMRGRWDKAVSIAREKGAAVLLCRGKPETVRFVAGLLPGLRAQGVRPVTLDELLAARKE